MTEDQEHAAALEDIARVRPAVEKLRGLFAAAMAADLASTRTNRGRSPESPAAPARSNRRSGP